MRRPPAEAPPRAPSCSFCGELQTQVKRLIAGTTVVGDGPGVGGNVAICDECVDLCREIIDEEIAGG